jgi:tRNA pseudouridine55 synthase
MHGTATTERPCGVLPVDKPEGPTSHDVVARARRALGERRIGHTGTLDPFASGLLLLLVGPATRLAEFYAPLPKRYRARLRLGAATDTDDRTGRITATTNAWRAVTPAALQAAFAEQRGEFEQVPPAYSAKKVRGERAYAAARRGEPADLRPVRVRIEDLVIVRIALPDIDFEVVCSTGTYVRAIARDVGRALGVHGHLVRLRRTAIGPVCVAGAVRLEDLDTTRAAGSLVDPLGALPLPAVALDAAALNDVAHGRAVPLPADGAPAEGAAVALTAAGRLVGIGRVVGPWIRPSKVLRG